MLRIRIKTVNCLKPYIHFNTERLLETEKM